MNQLLVKKQGFEYVVYCDGLMVYTAVAMQAVVDWLEENFSPPIKVRWLVGQTQKGTVK